MAWLSFAKDVLNQAQKTIDKALDIKDDVTNESIGKDIETFFASYGIGKENEQELLHENFNVAVKSQPDNSLAEPNLTNCKSDGTNKTEQIEGKEPTRNKVAGEEVETKSAHDSLYTTAMEYENVKEEGSDQQGMISEYSLTNIDPENPSIHYQLATELQIDKKSRTLPAVTVRDVGIECSVNAPLNETLPSIRNENSHEESLTQASEETEILEQQKKITELEDLLAIREEKLLEMNEICAGYMNEIDQLKRLSTLEDQARLTNKPSVDNEAVQNLEMNFNHQHQLNDEAQLKKLGDLSNTQVAKLKDELREKETEIQELRLEGEKLSKQNFQQSNIIKNLRIKEKDNEQQYNELRGENDELKNEIDRLRNCLAMKEDIEKNQMDVVKQLTNKKELLEKELTTNKVVARDAFTEAESLRRALSELTKKLDAIQTDLTARDKAEADRNLSIEVSVRQQLQLEFNKSSEFYEEEKKALTLRCQELSQMLVIADRQLLIEKERAKTEFSQLMQRLQETESRSDELSQALTTSTKPLHRQILILQQTLSAQKLAEDNEKKVLEDQLSEAQRNIAAMNDKHITSKNICIALESKVNELSQQLNDYITLNKQLSIQLAEEKSQQLALEESKSKNSLNIEIQTLNWKLNTLQQNFEIQTAVLEEEKIKSSTLTQLLQEKDNCSKSLHLDIRSVEEKRTNSSSPTPRSSSSPTPSLGRISNLSGSFESHSSNPWNSTDEVLDCSGLATPVPRSTLYETIRTGSYTAVFENLQSQMKSRDGEIAHLQKALQNQEQSRDVLALELSRTVSANQELMQRLEVLEQLKIDFAELKTKYNALLQMYGEKIEENEELRLDLVDVKEMYKIQIDELMKLE